MNRRAGDSTPLVTAGLIATTGYVCLCVLVQSAAHVLIICRCGGSPPTPFNPAAAVALVVGRIDWIIGRPEGCDVGVGTVWWVVGPVLLLVAALAVVSVLAWRRWKQSGAWLRQDILNREGIARRVEDRIDDHVEALAGARCALNDHGFLGGDVDGDAAGSAQRPCHVLDPGFGQARPCEFSSPSDGSGSEVVKEFGAPSDTLTVQNVLAQPRT